MAASITNWTRLPRGKIIRKPRSLVAVVVPDLSVVVPNWVSLELSETGLQRSLPAERPRSLRICL
jgi:hypothetical protein